MTGAPNAGYLWERKCEEDLARLDWTVLDGQPSAHYIASGKDWARLLRNKYYLSLQASNTAYLDKVLAPLKNAWQVARQRLTSGTTIRHLGLLVARHDKGDITIANPTLINAILTTAGLSECNPAPTPHLDGHDTSQTRAAESPVDVKSFQSTLGACRFLADTTHPDIAFQIGVLGHAAHNPCTRHGAALKRVHRHLRGKCDTGLRFRHSGGIVALEAYSDSDWAQCLDIRCSTSGIAFLVNGTPTHYASTKQPTIAHSSTEAELVAANIAAKDLAWLERLTHAWNAPSTSTALIIDEKPCVEIIDGAVVTHAGTPALGIDNKGCVDIENSNGVTKVSKHLDIKDKYPQQQVKAGKLRVTQVGTADEKADFLTKPLKRTLFERACNMLHLHR
jgi:hypothetical protein